MDPEREREREVLGSTGLVDRHPRQRDSDTDTPHVRDVTVSAPCVSAAHDICTNIRGVVQDKF
jgi:hypothetical protein